MRQRRPHRYSSALPFPGARLRRSIHIAAALVLVLTLSWVPTGLAVPTSARQTDDLPGVEGSTYESPSWGYTLEWDDEVWDVRLSRSNNQNDRLLLTRLDGASLLYVDGYDFFEIDPVSCIAGALAKLENRTAVAEIEPYEDPEGAVVAGEEDERAFAAYRYTVERTGETEEQVQYNECRTIVPGEAVVEITHIAPADVYEDEAALVADVLATLTIPAAAAEQDATPNTATPAATPAEATPAEATPDQATPEAATPAATPDETDDATPAAEGTDSTPTLTPTPEDEEATEEATPTAQATAATEETTEEATEEPTVEAAEEPTEAPTEVATEDATEEPEDEDATEEAPDEATEVPTEEATEEPEEEATEEPTDEATEEPEDETPTEEDLEDAGVDGTTYTSPTFGYSLEWDEDDWSAADATSEDDVDTLVLVSNASTLTITGLEAFAGDPADCLAQIAENLEAGPDVEEFEPALGADGEPLEIEDDDRAGAVYLAEVDGDSLVYRLECRILVEDEAVIQIVHEVPADDFNEEIGLVTDVLDTLALVGQEPEADEEPADEEPADEEEPADDEDEEEIPLPADEDQEEDEEDAAGDEGVDGNTYTSPNFGYSVEWDEDDWTPARDESERGSDFLSLNGRRSALTIWGLEDFGGDPLLCFSTFVDVLGEDTEEFTVEDVEPLEDEDGEPIEGEEDDRVFGAFLFTLADTEDGFEEEFVYYVECRTLVEDESVLVVIHGVEPQAYEAEASRREEVLETLELPETDAGDDGEGEEEQTPEADDEDEGRDRIDAPEDGDLQTYTSDLFGYTVAWDRDVWSLTDRTVEDDRDYIEISAESGFLTFDGQVRFGGNPTDCLNTAITNLQAMDGVEDWQRVRDPSLLPEGAGGRDSASALFSFTLAPEGRTPTPYLAYVDCRVLVPGESVLAIVYTVPAEDYEAERDDLGAILRAIDLPGA